MSATSGVNVLRYSALCFGVLYGFYHQRTITSSQRSAAAEHEYEHKQKLIAEAKKAYAKSQQPAAATQSSGGRELFSGVPGEDEQEEEQHWRPGRELTPRPFTVNQDPNDPNFDLGAYIEAFLGQKA
ncbi:ATP synthase E chain-domain-containing protein [Podospora conica]|nr:ATP synthase E chain-domain-containing protein [Schizothecium conicum]